MQFGGGVQKPFVRSFVKSMTAGRDGILFYCVHSIFPSKLARIVQYLDGMGLCLVRLRVGRAIATSGRHARKGNSITDHNVCFY